MRHSAASNQPIAHEQYQRSSAGQNAGRAALAPVAPWIERLARVGFAAKAVLYTVVGVLAFQAAFGNGGDTTGSQGALQTLVRQPFGPIALVVIAAGLFGYAAWRMIEAALDPEGRGNGPKGVALRASFAARGLLHAALGVQAIRLATGGGESGNDGAESWTAKVLDAPFGAWLVVACGAGIVGYGLYQLYRAWVAKLSKQLDLASLSREAGSWVVRVCRVGIAARGIVFAVVGVYLARAGYAHNASQAADTGEALAVIGRQPFGPWLLASVALGLIAYGVYEMVNARYRVIRPV